MSLNQKYTWNDFLKDHPDLKEKKIKRTSKEGEKAFEAAFKAKMKEYLKDCDGKIEKRKENALKRKAEITLKVQSFQKKKDWSKARFYQKRVGKQDAAIARLITQDVRIKEKIKAL